VEAEIDTDTALNFFAFAYLVAHMRHRHMHAGISRGSAAALLTYALLNSALTRLEVYTTRLCVLQQLIVLQY
jgi:predicted protein tyrosine phosphatase